MAHHVYQTDAFILNSNNSGDGHRVIDLFTRELGRVRASAQSVRHEKSKLRYSLQDYSYSNISLVRGREVWKITGAKEVYNAYYHFLNSKDKMLLCGNVFLLLNRLLRGEEKNSQLFEIVTSFVAFLDSETLSPQSLKSLECIVVLKVLHNLGYIGESGLFSNILDNTIFEKEMILAMHNNQKQAVQEINHALEVSHL